MYVEVIWLQQRDAAIDIVDVGGHVLAALPNVSLH